MTPDEKSDQSYRIGSASSSLDSVNDISSFLATWQILRRYKTSPEVDRWISEEMDEWVHEHRAMDEPYVLHLDDPTIGSPSANAFKAMAVAVHCYHREYRIDLFN